jgi:hypothetical protein
MADRFICCAHFDLLSLLFLRAIRARSVAIPANAAPILNSLTSGIHRLLLSPQIEQSRSCHIPQATLGWPVGVFFRNGR